MNEFKKILLVEDNPDHAFFAKSAIVAAGSYHVNVVSNGADALEAFDREAYDLVILDYMLPDTNGLAVLQRMLEKSKQFPIIMMTGLGSETVAVEAMKRGAYDYVVKSHDYYTLLPFVIEEALEKRDLIRLGERMRQELDDKVARDRLTGLYNRSYFEASVILDAEIAKRYDRMLTVVIVRIANFKQAKEEYGAEIGDGILVSVASLLKEAVREGNLLSRYCDEEFVFSIMGKAHEEADNIIGRIEAGAKDVNRRKQFPLPIKLSIGISVSRGEYTHLVEKAYDNMRTRTKEHS